MRGWRAFRKAKEGLAAVEFALLLPVMIGLFFGVVETTLALLCRADVSIMASTAANLISEVSTPNSTDISNVYSAAGAILYPNPAGAPTTQPTIRITSVIYDATSSSPTSAGKVAWTCMQTGSGTFAPTFPATRNKGDTVTFTDPSNAPLAIMPTNGSVIIAEVAYGYTSPTMQVIKSKLNLTSIWYTKPRRVAQIPAPSPAPSGCST
jgi:Flp pilus assembly protein TadG